MTPGQAQQYGNDLACLAASIAKIAEEIKAMYDFDHDKGCDEPEPPKPPTFEELRGVLVDKASSGHREAVQALIQKYGAKKLSDLDPSQYAAILAEARAIK